MPLPSFLERLRRGSDAGAARGRDAVPLSASDVEAMRVRARRRLIGMVVLVGAGVVGFPWLFETQPRPMSGDIQIVQAGKPDGKADAEAGAPRTAGKVSSASRQATAADTLRVQSIAEPKEVFEDTPPPRAAVPSAPAVAASKAAPKVADKAEKAEKADKPAKPADKASKSDKPADKPSDKDKAHDKAGKATDKPADKPKTAEKDKAASDKDKAADKTKSDTRYVVQFGAFAEVAAAREVRQKAERLGLKTYAQEVDTPQGKRIRVRLGPFNDKADAEKALATLRKGGLTGAILTL